MLTFFGKRSETGFEMMRERAEAQYRVAQLEAELVRLLDSYIVDITTGSSPPAFGIMMPSGNFCFAGSREKAREMLRKSINGGK